MGENLQNELSSVKRWTRENVKLRKRNINVKCPVQFTSKVGHKLVILEMLLIVFLWLASYKHVGTKHAWMSTN